MKTLEELEYTVSKTLQANHTASLFFQQPEFGDLKVDIEKSSWYSLIKNDFQVKDKELHFEVKKTDPFICLFFQIKGNATFMNQQAISISEKHHSLNYLPGFESQYIVNKHTHLQNLSIKINPQALEEKLLEKDIHQDRWRKFMDYKQAFVTLNASKKMSPAIWDTLFQLLHCPYSGALGQMYKELLVKMLFIHQVTCFCDSSKPSPIVDNKLHKRDIETLHSIKEYLEQHYLDDLSLDTIVKEFGLNTFKLKYGFKKLFGTTVMKYIDDKKMIYAKQLLVDRHIEIADIAEKLGYNHYNNFSTAFKRKFGYSPAFFAEKESYVSHI